MTEVAALHREAMALAAQAALASNEHRCVDAEALYRAAFIRERQAAMTLLGALDLEPNRSSLFRSAAALAMDCNEHRDAERLIAYALSGNPPEPIADELRNLWEQVYFRRHLELKGVKLEAGEVQMALSGQGVGFGIAPSDAVMGRVRNAEKILERIAERRAGRPFREGGPAQNEFRQSVELYLSVPRAASYAVTLRVGRPKEQTELSELVGTPEIIDEFLQLMLHFDRGDYERIRSCLPDEAYYNNFVGLAKQLAPDGDDITLVGFTAERNGEAQSLTITKTRDKRRGQPTPQEAPRELTVTGRLLFADERRNTHIIRLIEDAGTEHKIAVPPGMMSDIVKPLWRDRVTVVGVQKRKTIHLQDITLAAE
jgi:hypothetical protein